jgi:hypothetical protein
MVTPLYQLNFNDWWFHHVNGCDNYPPAEGDYIDLPAGGTFSIEIGSNRAKTSLSYNGRDMSDWPDGNTYPDNYNDPNCIIHPNLHTQNQQRAAGTAFAISYQSDIKQVTPDNLVVFSVRYNTPWKRVVVYDVPAAMPACPPGGCICAWGWVPNGCGQPNIYHQAFKCRVSGAKSTTPLAAPKPPVWCENEPGKCVKGAKQMIYWNQNERNNVFVSGWDASGDPKSPGYNSKMGFPDGAQNDIFAGAPSSAAPSNTKSDNTNSDVNYNTGSGSTTPSNAGNNNSGNNNNNNPSPPASSSSSSSSSPAVNTQAAATNNTNTNTNTNTDPNLPTTGKPNPAPSCNGSRRRRRRAAQGADVSIAKRSSLVAGLGSHKKRLVHRNSF